jgi:ABC-type dipeptide/oligopeptide/nickel transport systems, permease components
MRRITGKLVRLVVVLYLVTFGTFMLVRLFPGDPVEKMIPFGTNLETQRAQLRKEIGLDKPAVQQYGSWIGGLAIGDFGKVYPSRTPVSKVLSSAAPVTLLLIFYAQLLALLVAIPLGVLTAYRAGTWLDKIAGASAFGLLSIPSFVLGLYLAYFVGAKLRWLPAGQYVAFGADPVQHFRSMALPTISLAAGQIALYMRLLRSDMIATLQESFVKTARSKGVTNRRILWRHAFRPSSLTLLTFAGLNIGTLVGSAVVVETVFSLPGLGTEIYKAIIGQQYVALQSYVALIAVGYVLINFGVDFLYTVLDPRIRHGRVTS